jgi:aromatic ring-opening dioxygenase LigB subunit
VSQDEEPADCRQLGKEISAAAPRAGLLVMADGSARRGPRAPGHFDERAAAFDAQVERALRACDLQALHAIDPALARELMATGRPAWQVLAGATHPAALRADVMYAEDPFGVMYVVAFFGPSAFQTSAG